MCLKRRQVYGRVECELSALMPQIQGNPEYCVREKIEIQLENSYIPVVCEQVPFETYPMEGRQALGILVRPATIK